jgi:hypothetical protein
VTKAIQLYNKLINPQNPHMTLKIYIVLTALALLLLPQSVAAQGNLVVNGTFESGSNGWTLTNGAIVAFVGDPGMACFLVSSNASPANEPTASQAINGLMAGTSYIISGNYEVGKDRGGASPANASFGVAIDDTFLFEVAASPNGSWQSFSFSYTAASSDVLLSLASQINGTGVEYAIDNISMEAVPEPNSLWLIGIGGIARATFLRNRRKDLSRI